MFALILCSFLLLSCETQSDFDENGNSLNPQSTLTRDDDEALTLPPGMREGDANPRQKLEGLKGMKGVNVDKLFSENIRDTDRRFDRLEDAVKDFRREYESIKPEIIRLVAIERDMQQLINLLNDDVGIPESSPQFATLQNDPLQTTPEPLNIATPPAQVAPKPVPVVPVIPVPKKDVAKPAPVPKKIASAPPPPAKDSNGNTSLTKFRYGEHSDYTRLVIDASGRTSYATDLDPSGEILKITLPKSVWTGAMSKNYGSNPIIESYTAQTNANTGETLLYVSFKKPVKIVNQGALTSDSAPRYRIFIDIME